MNIQLVDRDRYILENITKWRFLLSRQIRILSSFTGQRACDRRLKKLIENGYIERKKFLYEIPALYFATEKAKRVFLLENITKDTRIERIQHDIAIVDTATYFIRNKGVDIATIKTERELRYAEGKKGRKGHRPDFIFSQNGKTVCVEIELNVKKQETLEKNIDNNYFSYDSQIWIVPSTRQKIIDNLKMSKRKLEIIELEEIEKYAKAL